MKFILALLGTVALLATPVPVAAGDAELEHIDGIMYGALAEFQAVHDDPDTPTQCRDYTDALMTTLDVVGDAAERPDSFYVGQLLAVMLPPLATARNDCSLAA